MFSDLCKRVFVVLFRQKELSVLVSRVICEGISVYTWVVKFRSVVIARFDDFSPELFPSKDDGSPDYCRYYQPELVMDVDTGDQRCSNNTFNKDHVVSCPKGSQFAYNNFEFEETLVTEWDAVCGKVRL